MASFFESFNLTSVVIRCLNLLAVIIPLSLLSNIQMLLLLFLQGHNLFFFYALRRHCVKSIVPKDLGGFIYSVISLISTFDIFN